MKVLMYEPTGYGGHALYAKDISEALSNNGIEILLLTSRPYTFSTHRLKYKYIDSLKQMRGDSSYLKVRPLWAADRFYRSLTNAYKRNRLCHFIKPDIVHLQLTIPLVDQIYVPLLAKRYRTIYTAHNVTLHNKGINNNPVFLARIYQSVTHLIVHTSANKKQLLNEFGISSEKISIIPHGADISLQHPITQEDAKNRLKISDRVPVILFFGSIRTNKGLDILLKAMPIIIKYNPKTQLVIAGSMPLGESFDKYARLIKELRLEDNTILEVRWIKDEDMELYFQASDIIALPYTSFSSQSGVLLQTYKYGKPVVVTDVGGLGETVSEDETGIIVDQLPEDIATGIIRLLEDKRNYNKFSQNMFKAVREKYNWDSVAKRTIEVYKKMLSYKGS